MKVLVVFLFLATVGRFAHAYDRRHNFQDDVVRRSIEKAFGSQIRKSLEKFKETMKTGNEAAGVPKLDPLAWEHQLIQVAEEQIIADGEVSNINVEGLSNYTVHDADFQLMKKTLVISMSWPNIKGNTLYNLNATVQNQYPVYGTGDVKFVIHDFKYATNVKVNYVLGSKKVSIDKISNTKMSLGKLEFEITGLFHNEELSQELSPVISEMAPEVLVDFHEEITSQLNIIMVKYGNKFLEKIDVSQIIHI